MVNWKSDSLNKKNIYFSQSIEGKKKKDKKNHIETKRMGRDGNEFYI